MKTAESMGFIGAIVFMVHGLKDNANVFAQLVAFVGMVSLFLLLRDVEMKRPKKKP